MTDPISASPSRSSGGLGHWLWNPFEKIAGGASLVAGVVILLITGVIASFSNTHFDGVLDTHVGHAAPLWVFLGEGIANWLCLAVVLWIAGLILTGRSRKFRALDLFGTQALARWPYLLAALICSPPGFQRYSTALITAAKQGQLLPAASVGDTLIFWGATLVILIVTVWFVALAWKSFRISCDVRGGKAITLFIVGIILAEVISKTLILKGFASLI